ncbi:maleylpyruvate isomerase family mycothiol-dependent enzyme [Nonomuraea sp. NPDC050663]|uniref:maleylpyruvate isomerase family mycothiol-dependent enzyme n=1 Tax=Nonomuraea sp. NPDC050663 TaxID=3364370 RepID=UPI0037BBE798
MDAPRLLACLQSDYAALRTALAAAPPTAPVPTCPEWTAADLSDHVAHVYLHKVEALLSGGPPHPWPPSDPVDLEESYVALLTELTSRSPGEKAWSWYPPEQNVAFWIRRMAHETVIHRIDAELAAGQPVSPVPDDLALDGIDELLTAFLAFSATEWPEEMNEVPVVPGEGVLRAGSQAWTITLPGALVQPGTSPSARATVTGSPEGVLRWAWGRGGDGVAVSGDAAWVDGLRRCLAVATQ